MRRGVSIGENTIRMLLRTTPGVIYIPASAKTAKARKRGMVQFNEAVPYASLALSLTAFGLFLYDGFEDADVATRDGRLVDTSRVWHYNGTSGVASLDESVTTACVALDPDDCAASSGQGIRLAVGGGLRLGVAGPILRGVGTDRIRAEDASGQPVFLASLATGAVLVGSDDTMLPATPGVRIVGKPTDGTQHDSAHWAATDGFALHAPGSDTPYATVHRIVHKEDASIVGVRISPPTPIAAPERSIHITAFGIVVGDAPANFIHANTAHGSGANLLVYGSAHVDASIDPDGLGHCTSVPVDLADLYDGASVAWRALRVDVHSCSNQGGLNNATVLASGTDFATCQGGLIYFNDGTSHPLGTCVLDGYIYYCRAEVTGVS